MYLIVSNKKKGGFRVVKNYRAILVDGNDKFDVYCGKKGANKGKRVAKKVRNNPNIEVIIEE